METTTGYISDKLKKALQDAQNYLKGYEFKEVKKLKEAYDKYSIFEFCEKTNSMHKISIIWDKLKEEWLSLPNSGYKADPIKDSLIEGTFDDIVPQKDEFYFFFKKKITDVCTDIYAAFVYGEKTEFEKMALSQH